MFASYRPFGVIRDIIRYGSHNSWLITADVRTREETRPRLYLKFQSLDLICFVQTLSSDLKMPGCVGRYSLMRTYAFQCTTQDTNKP